jgi:regulator of replication initiation timing
VEQTIDSYSSAIKRYIGEMASRNVDLRKDNDRMRNVLQRVYQHLQRIESDAVLLMDAEGWRDPSVAANLILLAREALAVIG